MAGGIPADLLGGLGFGFKWNRGWMNDTLTYFAKDPVYRRFHHQQLTFALLYAFQENFVQPLSHDDVSHGKGSLLGDAGDRWQKLANLRRCWPGCGPTSAGRCLSPDRSRATPTGQRPDIRN